MKTGDKVKHLKGTFDEKTVTVERIKSNIALVKTSSGDKFWAPLSDLG